MGLSGSHDRYLDHLDFPTERYSWPITGEESPVFVERSVPLLGSRLFGAITGEESPVFVERERPATASPTTPRPSPGRNPRSSLSARRTARHHPRRDAITGEESPVFVERRPTSWPSASSPRPSPGRNPRSSLSGGAPHRVHPGHPAITGEESPVFVERRIEASPSFGLTAITGEESPVFVERTTWRFSTPVRRSPITGEESPVFVERPTRTAPASPATPSPGRNPRSSLSVDTAAHLDNKAAPSPGRNPRSSLSVDRHRNRRVLGGPITGEESPVFVERSGHNLSV